jgi:hypothetical protein
MRSIQFTSVNLKMKRKRAKRDGYNAEFVSGRPFKLGDKMKSAKAKKKAKLTDTERHKRFKETAREVGASEDPKAFDKAFKKVTSLKPS